MGALLTWVLFMIVRPHHLTAIGRKLRRSASAAVSDEAGDASTRAAKASSRVEPHDRCGTCGHQWAAHAYTQATDCADCA
jgi:hypothetical protein